MGPPRAGSKLERSIPSVPAGADLRASGRVRTAAPAGWRPTGSQFIDGSLVSSPISVYSMDLPGGDAVILRPVVRRIAHRFSPPPRLLERWFYLLPSATALLDLRLASVVRIGPEKQWAASADTRQVPNRLRPRFPLQGQRRPVGDLLSLGSTTFHSTRSLLPRAIVQQLPRAPVPRVPSLHSPSYRYLLPWISRGSVNRGVGQKRPSNGLGVAASMISPLSRGRCAEAHYHAWLRSGRIFSIVARPFADRTTAHTAGRRSNGPTKRIASYLAAPSARPLRPASAARPAGRP